MYKRQIQEGTKSIQLDTNTTNNFVSNSGLGITQEEYDLDDVIEEVSTNNEEEVEIEGDFDNEDFNAYNEELQETPKVNAFLPEFQMNRPVSMSFRGLKGPSFNSTTANSLINTELMATTTSDELETKCKIHFSSSILLYETYGEFEYDRHPELATCNQLTPQLAQMIKVELNDLKSTMDIHEDSRCCLLYTSRCV